MLDLLSIAFYLRLERLGAAGASGDWLAELVPKELKVEVEELRFIRQASRREILLRGRGFAAAKQLTGIALWVATVVISDRIWCAGTIGVPVR